MDAKQLLQWYVDIGADEATGDTPVNRFSLVKSAVPPVSSIPAPAPPVSDFSIMLESVKETVLSSPSPSPLPPAGTIEALKEAQATASKTKTLEELKSAIEKFDGLLIKRTATQIVFADGVPAAKIMLVGEAPGADEDRTGRCFAGENGELLDKMLAAIGLSREENVYITNLVNWRPPGNRAPTDAEIALSLPFVRRHIELVNPAILVYVGGVSAKALAETAQGITRLRGKWMDYKSEGLTQPIPAIALFHPSYLIRSPLQKKLAWADLQMLKEKIKELGL